MSEELKLSSIPTLDLVAELSTRAGVTKYPKYVTAGEVFCHRQTLPGNCIMLVIRDDTSML